MTRVLVVDDRDDNRALLRALLRGHGCEVEEARHGAEALARARRCPPDVIVSDLLMPVMDGYTLLRQWKADAQLQGAPFIVYTATYTDPRDERLALDLGADAFLVKPCEPDAFLDELMRVLGRQVAEPAASRQPVLDAPEALESYNAALVRKLEQRVTEREEALRALAESAAQWRSLFENSMDMVLLTAPSGEVLAANPAACQGLGLSEQAIIARGRGGLVDPGDARLTAMLAERAATGHVRGELTMLRGNGTRFPAELTSSVYRDALGRERTSMILRDVSQRQRTEAELRSSLARQAALQAALSAHALVSMTDVDGRITYANEHFCRISGYSHDELLGRTHRVVKSGLHPAAFYATLWATISSGGIWHGELCNRAKDGTPYWLDATIYPVLDAEGRRSGYAEMGTDITERKRAEAERAELEQQLREAQKMDAVGTLAAGIAHDFNNVLGAILGYTALAANDAAAGQPVDADLAQIRAAAERARALVQRLLAFSRRQPVHTVVQPLRVPVEEALAMLRSMLPVSAQLEAQLADEPLLVRADATQIQQILLNLVTNAWQALPGGRGRISVVLRALELSADAAMRRGLGAGGYAHLSVADDGSGIDEATRARIFEPFFTTKPAGQGTGLGLATVYGIVRSHGGTITVDSEPGRGTTFTVLLPLVDGAAELQAATAADAAEAIATQPADSQPDGGRVLYIDDDETLSLVAERLLRRAGFAATTCTDAAQALSMVRAAPGAFDAVVTDQQMPGLSGLEIARALAESAPQLPVFLASGYVDAALQGAAAAAGVRTVLNKERLAEDLASALRSVLPGVQR